MKHLYKYSQDFGHQGYLSGTFIVDSEEINKLKGSEVYFGEVLGKHSEIFGKLDDCTLTMVTDDQEFIAKMEQFGLQSTGFNPLNYEII